MNTFKDENYEEVALDDQSVERTELFVDTSSKKALLLSYVVLCFLILTQTFLAFMCPDFIGESGKYYKIENQAIKSSIHLELTILNIIPSHKRILINCSMVRNNTAKEQVLEVSALNQIFLLQRGHHIHEPISLQNNIKLYFDREKEQSAPYTLFDQPITSYDSITLQLTLSSDFQNCNSIYLVWYYENPSSIRFSKYTTNLSSLLCLYSLLIYISMHRSEGNYLSHMICLILGISGFFASNPLSFIFPDSFDSQFASSFMVILFICVLRLFILIQLQNTVSPENGKFNFTTFMLCLLFIVYSGFETNSINNHFILLSPTPMTFHDKLLIIFHVMYIIGLIYYQFRVFLIPDSPKRRTFVLVVIGLFSIITSILSIISPLLLQVMPQRYQMINSNIQITLAAFLLFLFRSKKIEYQQVIVDDKEFCSNNNDQFGPDLE